MEEKSKKKQPEKKSSQAVSVESYKKKIVTFLRTYGKKSMPLNELESKCRTKKAGRENFTEAFSQLRTEGVVDTAPHGLPV